MSNCNCDYACPCQFESLRPTYGDCRGFAAVRIDKGHFGDVSTRWPRHGRLLYASQPTTEVPRATVRFQAVIDERADGKQRDALVTILSGGETNEGATHWWVYTKMSNTIHPPLFKHIEFDVNIERRKARIVITDVLESTARPIRSPATGAEHRVRINLPNGIEYDLAEIGSGTTKTMASIALDLKDTYFHFTALRQSGKGVVHSR